MMMNPLMFQSFVDEFTKIASAGVLSRLGRNKDLAASFASAAKGSVRPKPVRQVAKKRLGDSNIMEAIQQTKKLRNKQVVKISHPFWS
jgi:hypothetical protein